MTITDTVGFIQKLPHGLVEAFKSTLSEVRDADLILRVVDISKLGTPISSYAWSISPILIIRGMSMP